MIMRIARCVVLSLLVMAVLPVTTVFGEPSSATIPASVTESLDNLKISFGDVRSFSSVLNPGGYVPRALKQGKAEISSILTYSASSLANADALADYLSAPLEAYHQLFESSCQ